MENNFLQHNKTIPSNSSVTQCIWMIGGIFYYTCSKRICMWSGYCPSLSPQMNQSVLKLTVSTTETAYRPPVQKDILYLEPMYLSVMLTDSTHHYRSASGDRFIVLFIHFMQLWVIWRNITIILLLQCHSSTGHCWCVDSRGQERAGNQDST